MSWTWTKLTSDGVPARLNRVGLLSVKPPAMQLTVSVSAPETTDQRAGVVAPVLVSPALGYPSATGEGVPHLAVALFNTEVQSDPATVLASAVLASLT